MNEFEEILLLGKNLNAIEAKVTFEARFDCVIRK